MPHPRRVVFAHLPRLALACAEADAGGSEDGQTPTLSRAVLVVDEESEKRPFSLRSVTRIVDCTDDLLAQGVRPPMRVLDAQRYVPSLDVVVIKRSRLRRELDYLAELCLVLSPLVEPADDGLYLDLTGIPRERAAQLDDIETLLSRAGHNTHLVASPGKRLSRAAALARSMRGGAGARVIDDDAREQAVGHLPLLAIGLSPELCEQLERLGVKHAGALVGLKKAGLSARLLGEARAVLDLIAHHDRAPVVGIAPPEEVREKVELDDEVREVEPLLFVLLPACQRLLARLLARGQALAALKASFFVRVPYGGGDDERGVHEVELLFPEPLEQAHALLRAIRARLEHEGMPGEVYRVVLSVDRQSAVFAVQRRLALAGGAFDGASEDPEQARVLSGLLAELEAELGPGNVGCLWHAPHLLPERMSALLWPPRRGGSAGDLAARAENGRFLAGWPWPLCLLPTPVPAHRQGLSSRDIRARHPFCRLEGEDEKNRPYVRDYEIVITHDGRRALGLTDPEDGELCIHGWFS